MITGNADRCRSVSGVYQLLHTSGNRCGLIHSFYLSSLEPRRRESALQGVYDMVPLASSQRFHVDGLDTVSKGTMLFYFDNPGCLDHCRPVRSTGEQ